MLGTISTQQTRTESQQAQVNYICLTVARRLELFEAELMINYVYARCISDGHFLVQGLEDSHITTSETTGISYDRRTCSRADIFTGQRAPSSQAASSGIKCQLHEDK